MLWNESRFLLYKLKHNDDGTIDKLPISPLDFKAISSGDKAHHVTLDVAQAMADAGLADGVALHISPPYFFLDVDGRTEHPLVDTFAGAFYEVSTSGRGCHVIGRYNGERPDHRCKVVGDNCKLELYTDGRFVALTFKNQRGNPDMDCTPALLLQATAGTFAPREGVEAADWTTEPVADWRGPNDDDELIKMMLAASGKGVAAAGFGGNTSATLLDLWHCNSEALAAAYPSESLGKDFDHSSADAALAAHLAFWTGKNCDRMWRLVQQSGLMRDKWNRDDYREDTIRKACGITKNVLQVKLPDLPPAAADITEDYASKPQVREGSPFLGLDAQMQLFAGCCYVESEHAILTPEGVLLKPDTFRARFGGYVFAIDHAHSKVTDNAWKAFTESQMVRFPRATGHIFRPDLPPGHIIKKEGMLLVNSYVPAEVPRKAGDPKPFLDHVRYVLPDPRDQQILLAYCAAIVQYPGRKFQWTILLQGTEGNGKSVFSRCVGRAVGSRYSRFPPAEDIANKFNSWLYGSIFIGVEDIYVPGHKSEVIETLKPMITNDAMDVQGKGADQVTREICCNFIFNSNFKDAIRKTENDRRFAVMYCRQQEAEDIKATMPPNWLHTLYTWLHSGGWEIVAEFLHTYPIPVEFDPTKECQRAPETSSTREAVQMSIGSVGQEIREACEEGRPGFAGGWVSSIQLANLLQRMRAERIVPPAKRRELMRDLGYILHPALPDGRAISPTMIDGGKPRLYIQSGHISVNIDKPARVVEAYVNAQQLAANSSDQLKSA